MREMKDSGLGYLGEIPAHWNTERIKNHLRFSPDKNPGDAMILSLYREHGIVPKDSRDDNHNVTSEDTSNYRYVRVGDFVVNKMKAPVLANIIAGVVLGGGSEHRHEKSPDHAAGEEPDHLPLAHGLVPVRKRHARRRLVRISE